MDDIFMPGNFACGAAIFFLFGIISASEHWNSLLFLFLFAGTGIGIIIYKLSFYKIVGIFVAAFLIGFSYYSFYISRAAALANFPFGKSVSVSGIIEDEPSPSSSGILLVVNARPPFKGEITIFTQDADAFEYGDLIKASGVIDPPDSPGGNPFLFSRSITIVGKNYGNRLRAVLIHIKEGILRKFDVVLPPDQAALLGGIAFGTKQNFTPELKKDMALAGLTHMVAISGYNITIIIISAGWMLKGIFSRRATFIATAVFIAFFILMSGISASAIRAAIMGCIALISQEAGRSYDIRNSIVFTATAMAMQDPTVVIYNAGFQLSFLSLVGIVLFEKPVKKLFSYSDAGFLGWKESALTTFCAQLGVMPVLIATFGVFSMTSIIANVLVLGTIPLTMFFGFILAPLGFLSKSLALFAGKITSIFLGYQLFVIKLFAQLALPLPFAFSNTLSILLYYAFLIIFSVVYA